MNKPHSAPAKTKIAKLRKAELLARLAVLPCAPKFTLDLCPAERLRLELSTHQIELEAQNQELREAQQRTEEARARYSDLYDFSPVSYLTLNQQGCVQEINLTGSDKLGCERSDVLGKPLMLWLPKSSHATFQRHLSHVFKTQERVEDELMLRSSSGALRHVSMTSITITQGPEAGRACRSVLVDITLLKEKEAQLTDSRQQLRNLSAHLDQVREDERRHLAREIHDDLGQKLTALRFEVVMLGEGKAAPQPSNFVPSLLQQCVFQANLDTDSTRTWTVIPGQTGHRFQSNLDSL